MDVVLIDIANDPLVKLYGAYRTCYSPKTPREVWEDIARGDVSREKIVQFVELLHIADLRLCTRAQWEIRQMVAKMRAELMRKVPELARYLQPKCGERRMGYCDEDIRAYEACPLSAARPHKLQVIEVFKRV